MSEPNRAQRRRGTLTRVSTTSGAGRPQRIVYQGEPGSNSHLACEERHPGVEAVACASFEDTFAAVESGDADLAMIPIDNSLAGRVADIHHFLPTSPLHIVGEHFLRIRFALLGVPGATLDDVKTVHSHVHALGQCRRVIREHGFVPVISGDTAGAAREVKEAGDRTQAAISPPLAAGIYGLDVLLDDVEDEDHNTTRFVILSRDFVQAPASNGPVVTSFVFNVRNLPAALYKALGGFATNGVNMTKLESYMIGGSFFATMFYADIEGHPKDRNVALALKELEFFSKEMKILGVYPGHTFRANVKEAAE